MKGEYDGKRKRRKTRVNPCIYDFIFKSVMLDPESKDYLIGYINMLTKLPIEIIKKNIKIENIEHTVENKNDRRLKSDIIVSIGKLYINIEMNKDYYDGLFLKNTAYTQKIASTMYNVGEDFDSENKIYQINFDNFDYFEDNQEIYEFIMKERTTNRIKDENYVEYHINLEYIYNLCYNKPINELSKLERYCLLLKADNKEFADKISGDDKIMSKVRNKIEDLSEDEKMIGLYDAEKIAEKVRNTQINNAKKEGIKEGIEKGVQKEKLEIAKNMINENIDVNIISKVTGLNIKDIENLK